MEEERGIGRVKTILKEREGMGEAKQCRKRWWMGEDKA